MKSCQIFNHKCFLGFFNVILLVSKSAVMISQVKRLNFLIFKFCGIVVLMTGFYLFTDNKRLLLSSLLIVSPDETNPLKNLKHPLFLYVAFSLTILGMIIISISFIGCCISLLNVNNHCCLLAMYFVMILLLLLVKFAVCIVITIWPKFLGLKLNATESVKVLQGKYGVPGFEKYTVGM